MTKVVLFDAGAHPALAEGIARELGVGLGARRLGRYPDGEVFVQLLQPVRRKEVFIVQPLAPPVDEHLVTLLVFADACRRAAADRITAIVPYLGYSRSDKRRPRRGPIAARMVAGLLEAVGIEHLITLDLHSPQIEGFFHVPVDSLTAVPVLCRSLAGKLEPNPAVIAPDIGAIPRATAFARHLGSSSVVVLHKRRESESQTDITHMVGDVKGKTCLIVDDMISTGGTIGNSIEALLEAGAQPGISIAATHGLLLPGARARLEDPAVRQVVVTDTVPIQPGPRLQVVSVAPLIARAMVQMIRGRSLDDLF